MSDESEGNGWRTVLLVGAALAVPLLLVLLVVLVGADGSDDEELGGEGLAPATAEPTTSESVTPTGEPTEMPSGEPTRDPTASPSLSALPTSPAPLPTTAVPTASSAPIPQPEQPVGVTVSMTLDRAAARVGERVTARARVTNGLAQPVRLQSCSVTARLGMGLVGPTTLTGRSLVFRERALDTSRGYDAFATAGCERGLLAPGASMALTGTWVATTTNGSAQDGPVEVDGRVTYLLTGPPQAEARRDPRSPRAGLAPVDPLQRTAVATPVQVRVTGGEPTRLSPVQAVDRALASPAFRAVVEGTDPNACAPDGLLAEQRVRYFDNAEYQVNVCTSATRGSYEGVVVSVDPAGRVSSPRRSSGIA